MKKKVYLNIKFLLFSSFLLVLAGCTSIIGPNDSNIESNSCDYKKIDEKIKDDNDTILWAIKGGSKARNCLDYQKSNDFFDKAEISYKETVDKDSTVKNILESSVSILVNNNANEYEGNTYEKVMLNTYKALNFASLNDPQNARVEFNRALDRQRRAKEYFIDEIKDKKEELSSKNQETEAKDFVYKEYDSLLNDFKAYPNFVNPFVNYIAGIYFLLEGDGIKARDLLKESYEMNPLNEQIKSDFELSQKYLSSFKNSKENYAWIIYENGEGMIKDEIRINIPLFIFTNNVIYTGIALPKIIERSTSYAYLEVNNKKTTEISNMDRVIKTEFKKKFPKVLSEAIANTISKTVAQKQLNDKSPLGGFLSFLYQNLTNRADIRSWSDLPKNFQSLRLKLNEKVIDIKNNQGKIIKEILIPKGKNALIYVKSQNVGNEIIHEILF